MGRDGKYHQGRFNPRNPEKYKGDPRNIIYRSSWELKFLQWCDRNENILEYGSEEFFIPYLDPTTGKVRRYFPDAYVKVKQADNNIKKYIIEIKPLRQTKPPVPGKKKRQTLITEALTYEKNCAKWRAAEEWCKDRLLEFKIITERELGL
jgi:hypothetical protein